MAGDQYLMGTADMFSMGKDRRCRISAHKTGLGRVFPGTECLWGMQNPLGWWHIPKLHLFLCPWHSRVLFSAAPACVGTRVVTGTSVTRGVRVAIGHVISLPSSLVVVVGSPMVSGT